MLPWGRATRRQSPPPELSEVWSHAYSTVLDRANTQIESPTNEEEQTRALKWSMALNHVLLRVANRGETRLKAIRQCPQDPIPDVARRKLLCTDLRWRQDADRTTNPPKVRTGQKLKTHNAIQSLDLAKQGQIRRAASEVSETGAKTSAQAPEVQTQVEVEHPGGRIRTTGTPEPLHGKRRSYKSTAQQNSRSWTP